MKEILDLVFHSFWTWAGSLILIAVVFDGLAEIIKAMARFRKTKPPADKP